MLPSLLRNVLYGRVPPPASLSPVPSTPFHFNENVSNGRKPSSTGIYFYWTTRYMNPALNHLHADGVDVRKEDLAPLAPQSQAL
jgi:hypothetical protein